MSGHKNRNRSASKKRQAKWVRFSSDGQAVQHTSAVERDRIYQRDGKRCGYCGTTSGTFHIDHIVPVWKGGASDWKNLTPACQACNMDKGASTDLIWMERLWKHGAETPKRTARIYLARGKVFSFPHEPHQTVVRRRGNRSGVEATS